MIIFLKRLVLMLAVTHLVVVNCFYSYQIPKKIHYVWFGEEEVPPSVKNVIQSWQKYMPDYKIIRWNEKNCPVHQNDYAKSMLKNKSYQWVSDYCRFYILEKEGGIYMDTDQVLNRSLKEFLTEPLVLALQSKGILSGSIFAAKPHHPFIKKMHNNYDYKKNTDYTPLPDFFTATFSQLYNPKYLIKKTRVKNQFVIYTPNELMLNFGGPENASEHLYASGKQNFLKGTYYYIYFTDLFLKQYAFLIDDEKEKKYIILLPNKKFYLVKETQNSWQRFSNGEKKYQWKRNFLSLSYKGGKTDVYECSKRQCLLVKSY